MLMVGTHVAHNAKLGSNNVIANCTQIAGHVELGDYITIGGNSAIHQKVRVGSHSMLSGLSATNHDLPPYFTYGGIPSRILGFNKYGLDKRGFSKESINEISRAFKLIRRNQELTNQQLIDLFKSELQDFEEIREIINFMSQSGRGVKFYPKVSA